MDGRGGDMKFIVRQRLFGLGGGFSIKNEALEDSYRVRSRLLALAKTLILSDMEWRELFVIRKKLLSLMPRFVIIKEDRVVARVTKRFAFWRESFVIDGEAGAYRIEGRVLNLDYSIHKEDRVAATVSKKFFALADTYGVDIAEGEDRAFMLALVIVIDQVCHEARGR
jgi:uncharacterized protein YxjI